MYIVRIWQGLGNQMFQYAFAKSLEKKSGKKVYLDTKHSKTYELESRGSLVKRDMSLLNFNLSLKEANPFVIWWWSYINRNKWYYEIVAWMHEHKIYPFGVVFEPTRKDVSDYKEEMLDAPNNTYIMGWFQNEAYFKEFRDELVQEFTPKNKMLFSSELKSIFDNNTTISIHVRRTDFKKNGDALPSAYYQKAFEFIENYVNDPYYIVFSDDIEWCIKYFGEKKRIYWIDKKCGFKDYEELYLMSRCNHNIIANSTFSWWAGWLNDNPNHIVICPRKWGIRQLNIIPDGWEIIE